MARWDLDRGVHPLATAVFRVNYLPFATIALAQAALQTLPVAGADAGGAATAAEGPPPGALLGLLGASLLQSVLLYLSLVTLMTGERAAEGAFRWARFGGFLWRLMLLGLPPALVWAAAFAGAGGAFAILSLFVTFAVLGLFGTVLADVAGGGDGHLGAALARGRRSLGAFLGWMLVGPVLASMALGLGFGVLSVAILGIGIGASGPPEALVPEAWFIGLLTLLGALGGAYVAALTAAALAKAWWAGGG
ncbi:MAG TPA: hypothetical protein VMM55_06085 [Thermohalobaculum sp.]|nr:hypothetical protein [Thermohalobaculum sp.]